MLIYKGEVADWIIYNDDRMRAADVEEADCDVFFSDPEYNIGINYGVCKDYLHSGEYLNRVYGWLAVAWKRLRPGGALWVMLPDEWVAYAFVHIEQTLKGKLRNWVKWAETFGTHLETKFSRTSRHILYFVKPGGEHWWDKSKIRIPSDRQLKYNDKRAVEAGKTPGDVWDFNRVAGTHAERCAEKGLYTMPDGSKVRIPTQLPEALLYQIVASTCPVGGKVLEFCVGSGSLARVVIRFGMGASYEGWELDPEVCRAAANRAKEVEAEYGKGLPSGPSLLDCLDERAETAPKVRRATDPEIRDQLIYPPE